MVKENGQVYKQQISVIVPVYNAERWLKRCINSILNQTYTNLEILLIDDGSTDASAQICDEYESKDVRVIAIHQENHGIGGARNTGLRNASGEYIAFIDHDDWIHPQYFELLLQAIEDTGCSISMCNYATVWAEQFLPPPDTSSRPVGTYEFFSREQLMRALFSVPLNRTYSLPIPYELVWAKLYRKDVLNDLFYKSGWGEDSEYNSRLYLRIESIVLVPQYLYYWIQHHSSTHRSQVSDGFEGWLLWSLKLLENIPEIYGPERGMALKRLMLGILSSRYDVASYKQFEKSKDSVTKLIKKIEKRTLKEFRSNRHISLFFRAAILMFYYVPATYGLFRWIVAKRPRLLQ